MDIQQSLPEVEEAVDLAAEVVEAEGVGEEDQSQEVPREIPQQPPPLQDVLHLRGQEPELRRQLIPGELQLEGRQEQTIP